MGMKEFFQTDEYSVVRNHIKEKLDIRVKSLITCGEDREFRILQGEIRMLVWAMDHLPLEVLSIEEASELSESGMSPEEAMFGGEEEDFD